MHTQGDLTRRNARHAKLSLGISLLSCLALLPIVSGQSRTVDDAARPRPEHTRAEQEAEQLVSLSAEKIIQLLRQEPGLLLQVKKVLVGKAFEQGRILDPEELTDDALFRLVREDAKVRVLATREIEDRYYIRAKPSREELEEGGYRSLGKTQQPASPEHKTSAQVSQEDAYWSTHEKVLRQPPGKGRDQEAGPETPSPGERVPEGYPPRGPNREVLRAEAEPSSPFDGSDAETSRMARISPSEIPELLDGSMAIPSAIRGPGAGSSGSSSYPKSPVGSALESRPVPTREDGEPVAEARLRQPRRELPPLPTPGDDQPVIRHRPNPYADVPSLYDLYTQVSQRPPVLERFGMDVFRNGTGNLDALPMDLPVGPEYVLGPGDGLNIELWGSVSERLKRVVDREGRVALPEVGTVLVAGRSLGDVQHQVQAVLRTQFRDIQADLSLARIRSVRVYVVGDVERPGAYDISSLSTPLNALYVAGGPTSRGSLRVLRHYRGKQLVQEIDVYDLLLRGIRTDVKMIEPGDTILVPPIGREVTVEGMVRRPAIYELHDEDNLAEVLELSGGVLTTGSLRHVDVERILAHEKRFMLRLDLPENKDQEAANKALEAFKVQDGDHVKIAPILPSSEKAVYLDGHVFHPGKYPYRDGMKVSDLIKSYDDLLPEPSRRHAEVIRLIPPDYTPVVLAFDLADALAGREQDLPLKPFDTIRVFGKYDLEDPPVVTVTGEVRKPGDHVSNGEMHLRDAISLAGGITPDAMLDDAQIFRRTADAKLEVISVNLGKALAGDARNDVVLGPKDRIIVHRNLARLDPPTVLIEGEVAKPGKYPLGDGMTASELVRLAGGFKRSAFTGDADLSRYAVHDGEKVTGERRTVEIAKAMAGDEAADVPLRDGDVLTVRQLSGWNDIGSIITVRGEVAHPGTYGIRAGERLSSILRRAGGLGPQAYPYGAVLERVQVRKIEEAAHEELIRRVQAERANLSLSPDKDEDHKAAKSAALQQWQATLDKLINTPPSGRLVIRISRDIHHWENTPADIEVRAGDVLMIPKKPGFVLVSGAVYNATAIAYRPGKSAGWYLKEAGGPTQIGNKKAIMVIRADGSVDGKGSNWSGSVLQPGDMVVVPEKALGGPSNAWKNVLQAAQLASAIAVTVSVIGL